MILLDPDQPEAAGGFTELAGGLPTRRTLLRHLRAAQAAVGLKGEVSVLLTTDAGIRGLNRRFRKKNKATDVLSFPAEPGFGVAGDLAISVDTACRQAAEHGHALGVELRVLMLHGMLHLAGMDHETDDGAMAEQEAKLRAKLKLPLGLIERVSSERPGAKAPLVSGGSRGLKPSAPSVKTEKQIPSGNDSQNGRSNGKGKSNGNLKSKSKSKNKSKDKSNRRSFGFSSLTARSAQDDRSLRSAAEDARGAKRVAR